MYVNEFNNPSYTITSTATTMSRVASRCVPILESMGTGLFFFTDLFSFYVFFGRNGSVEKIVHL